MTHTTQAALNDREIYLLSQEYSRWPEHLEVWRREILQRPTLSHTDLINIRRLLASTPAERRTMYIIADQIWILRYQIENIRIQ